MVRVSGRRGRGNVTGVNDSLRSFRRLPVSEGNRPLADAELLFQVIWYSVDNAPSVGDA